MVIRDLSQGIEAKLGKGKAILIFGARQTGKTTIMRHLLSGKDDVLWLNGDDADVRELFRNATATRLRNIVGRHRTLVIDEAQRLEEAGLGIKLICDQIPEVQVIATGSSAFELAGKTKEALTGRKWEFHLHPLSFAELTAHHGLLEELRNLPQRLVYGSYPEVVVSPGNEKEILRLLSDSFLYKDLLMLEELKKPQKLVNLLQALAFQIGNEVSYQELGRTVGLNNQTIEKYITYLEQAYVIFRLPALSRNHRNELKKSRKVYFWDNGIRNALIAQFSMIETRNDRGALWENYLVSERMKFLSNNGIWANSWFWRTYDQAEIDYLEEMDGRYLAYEFKWNMTSKARLPKAFADAYPNHEFAVIHPGNVEEFLGAI
jgi:uncharacterized protein